MRMTLDWTYWWNGQATTTAANNTLVAPLQETTETTSRVGEAGTDADDQSLSSTIPNSDLVPDNKQPTPLASPDLPNQQPLDASPSIDKNICRGVRFADPSTYRYYETTIDDDDEQARRWYNLAELKKFRADNKALTKSIARCDEWEQENPLAYTNVLREIYHACCVAASTRATKPAKERKQPKPDNTHNQEQHQGASNDNVEPFPQTILTRDQYARLCQVMTEPGAEVRLGMIHRILTDYRDHQEIVYRELKRVVIPRKRRRRHHQEWKSKGKRLGRKVEEARLQPEPEELVAPAPPVSINQDEVAAHKLRYSCEKRTWAAQWLAQLMAHAQWQEPAK